MTVYHLPKSDFPYTKLYEKPPQKNVLLLSCMDIRLLDNTAKFMDELNLQNRYDHVIFAGAGLGAGRGASKVKTQIECEDEVTLEKRLTFEWKHVFFDHLDIAVTKLKRDIRDIFILEHLDCGAYKYLQEPCNNEKYEKLAKKRELDCLENFHKEMANQFAKEIAYYCEKRARVYAEHHTEESKYDNPWNIQVHCLLMDLTGRVKDLPCPSHE